MVGVSYLDDHTFDKSQKVGQGDDPCNPLYWYPKPIPDYCFISKSTSKPIPAPVPVPVPVQAIPPPCIPPMSVIRPFPSYVPPYISAQPIPFPVSSIPLQPIPPKHIQPERLRFGVHMIPAMPAPGILSALNDPCGSPNIPYGASNMPVRTIRLYPGRHVGMVPGLPGLVSPNGGINILPFSDAYADVFERYKQQIITKKLKKKFNNYPWKL